MQTLQELANRRERMINYLKLKVEEEDWHGCADACMDLREIEAKISMITDKEK
jgi:hypothetical protein